MPEVTYQIEKEICVLSENARGWTKELNLVSWNGHPAKYDLREWSPTHERMGKGITLSREEMEQLIDAVTQMDEEEELPTE